MSSRRFPALELSMPALMCSAALLAAQPARGPGGPGADPTSVPAVELSPDHTKLLVMERTIPKGDAEVSPTFSALVVQPIGRGEIRRLILPWKARVRSVLWAPDGDRVAFVILEDRGNSLWVGDAYTGVIRMLLGPVLRSAAGDACQWFRSAEELLCSRIPTTPLDGAPQLERDLGTQLVVVTLSGSERPIGPPAIHGRTTISPDGKYLTVETVEQPYAGRLTVERSRVRTELWDASDGSVNRVLGGRGPSERPPESADVVPAGPRDFEWRGDRPATLVWVEAQDGGNPGQAAKVRDRLFQFESPFTGSPSRLADLEFRSRGVVWGGDGFAVLNEGWVKTPATRSWLVNPDREVSPRLLLQSPGSFITRPKSDGGEVLLTTGKGRIAYLRGSGAEGYLDRIDLTTGKIVRLWRAQAPFREEIVGVLDADEGKFITRRESTSEPPNYFIRDLKKNGVTPLTRFK